MLLKIQHQIEELEQSLQALLVDSPGLSFQQPVIQAMSNDLLRSSQVELSLLTCHLLHPVISGNKWYKLKYNLVQAQREGARNIISFGGAWSNHLHALAYACHEIGLTAIAIVRGDELNADANPMLLEAQNWGMQFKFVDRASYKQRSDSMYLEHLCKEYPNAYVVPEGGDNWLGVLGASTLFSGQPLNGVNVVAIPCGTGCSFEGARLGLPSCITLLGFPALKGEWYKPMLEKRLQRYSEDLGPWSAITDYHFGGFGKCPAELRRFMGDFEVEAGLTLDPVYTAKMLFGLFDMIQSGAFKPGTRILAVHTGGLQGRRGITESSPNFTD